MKKILLLLLLLAPIAHADILIQQVLYDPAEERGGEAVELRNSGTFPVDISGWVLATQTSETDATFPEGSVIQPGRTFLVADSGWSEKKDNALWRSADLEDSITLTNTAGFVELRDGNTTVDRVEWNETCLPGNSLLRIGSSFVESSADFFEGIPVALTSDVTLTIPVLEVSESLDLDPEGTLSIRNNGDSAITVRLNFNDLVSGSNLISKDALSVEGSEEINVQPNSEQSLRIRLTVPSDAQPGRYVSIVRVKVLDGSSYT